MESKLSSFSRFSKFRFIVLSLLVFVLALPVIAQASSYSISYEFAYQVTGQTRSFVGSDIWLLTDSTESGGYYDPVDYFTAGLYRDNSWPSSDSYIGSAQMNKVGFDSTYWTNVGNGNYYTVFTKTNNTNVVSGSGTIEN